MPGDPASAMFVRFRGRLKPEAMQALRATFGFTNAPLWKQYVQYLAHVAKGDLGISISYFPATVETYVATVCASLPVRMLAGIVPLPRPPFLSALSTSALFGFT